MEGFRKCLAVTGISESTALSQTSEEEAQFLLTNLPGMSGLPSVVNRGLMPFCENFIKHCLE